MYIFIVDKKSNKMIGHMSEVDESDMKDFLARAQSPGWEHIDHDGRANEYDSYKQFPTQLNVYTNPVAVPLAPAR